MKYTENLNLGIVEGSDISSWMTPGNDNMSKIDQFAGSVNTKLEQGNVTNDNLQAQIDTNKNLIGENTNSIAGINTRVGALEAGSASTNKKIDDYIASSEADLAKTNQQVANNSTRIGTLETSVANLKTAVNTHNTLILNNRTAAEKNAEDIINVNANLENIKTNISQSNETMNALILINKSVSEQNATDIENMKSEISDNTESIGELVSNTIPDIKSDIRQINQTMNSNDDNYQKRLNDLDDLVLDNKKSIDNTQQTINAINDDIQTLNSATNYLNAHAIVEVNGNGIASFRNDIYSLTSTMFILSGSFLSRNANLLVAAEISFYSMTATTPIQQKTIVNLTLKQNSNSDPTNGLYYYEFSGIFTAYPVQNQTIERVALRKLFELRTKPTFENY